MINDWTYIDEFDRMPEEAILVSCDTRDFHIIVHTELDYNEYNEIWNRIRKKTGHHYEKYGYSRSEILGYLKSLECHSGGKGDWRMLTFDVPGGYKGWVKYMRFIKVPGENCYICCTTECDHYIPLERGVYEPERIIQKFLAHQNDDD